MTIIVEQFSIYSSTDQTPMSITFDTSLEPENQIVSINYSPEEFSRLFGEQVLFFTKGASQEIINFLISKCHLTPESYFFHWDHNRFDILRHYKIRFYLLVQELISILSRSDSVIQRPSSLTGDVLWKIYRDIEYEKTGMDVSGWSY